MATRQQRKKRIRAQVDELMKDFIPHANQGNLENENFPGSKKGSKNMGLRGQTQQTLSTKSLGLHGKNTKSRLS